MQWAAVSQAPVSRLGPSQRRPEPAGDRSGSPQTSKPATPAAFPRAVSALTSRCRASIRPLRQPRPLKQCRMCTCGSSLWRSRRPVSGPCTASLLR